MTESSKKEATTTNYGISQNMSQEMLNTSDVNLHSMVTLDAGGALGNLVRELYQGNPRDWKKLTEQEKHAGWIE